MEPCQNDAVGTLGALGVSGDVAFDESGSMPLSQGQTECEITFTYEKTDWRYRFIYLYVGYFDGTPIDAIACSPGLQTSKKFLVKFSGAPTSAGAILFWEVRIPDNLQACQTTSSGPNYAILRPEQHGVTPLVSGQDFIIVTFPELMPDTDWGFEQLTVRKAFSEANTLGFVFTETSHSASGFTLAMSGAPDNGDYTLHWQVR
jgi:hypothetical protein